MPAGLQSSKLPLTVITWMVLGPLGLGSAGEEDEEKRSTVALVRHYTSQLRLGPRIPRHCFFLLSYDLCASLASSCWDTLSYRISSSPSHRRLAVKRASQDTDWSFLSIVHRAQSSPPIRRIPIGAIEHPPLSFACIIFDAAHFLFLLSWAELDRPCRRSATTRIGTPIHSTSRAGPSLKRGHRLTASGGPFRSARLRAPSLIPSGRVANVVPVQQTLVVDAQRQHTAANNAESDESKNIRRRETIFGPDVGEDDEPGWTKPDEGAKIDVNVVKGWVEKAKSEEVSGCPAQVLSDGCNRTRQRGLTSRVFTLRPPCKHWSTSSDPRCSCSSSSWRLHRAMVETVMTEKSPRRQRRDPLRWCLLPRCTLSSSTTTQRPRW